MNTDTLIKNDNVNDNLNQAGAQPAAMQPAASATSPSLDSQLKSSLNPQLGGVAAPLASQLCAATQPTRQPVGKLAAAQLGAAASSDSQPGPSTDSHIDDWLRQIPGHLKLIRIPEIYNRQCQLLTPEHPDYFPLLSMVLGEFAVRYEARELAMHRYLAPSSPEEPPIDPALLLEHGITLPPINQMVKS